MFALPGKRIVLPKAQNCLSKSPKLDTVSLYHVLPCAATCHVTLVDMCLNVFDHFCVIMMVFKWDNKDFQ